MKWTMIVAASDCSSVQSIRIEADDAQTAATGAFRDVDWLEGFELIAVIPGHGDVFTRDDSCTAERLIKV